MMQKYVNGVLVDLSSKEEAALLKQREADAAEVASVAPRSKENILADIDALRHEVETLSTLDQLQALSNG